MSSRQGRLASDQPTVATGTYKMVIRQSVGPKETTSVNYSIEVGMQSAIFSERGGRGESSKLYAWLYEIKGDWRSTKASGMTAPAIVSGFGPTRRGESMTSPRHSACWHAHAHRHDDG